MNIERVQKYAVQAALEAGQIIMDIRSGGFDVNIKSDGSSVSAADLAADKKIAQILSEHFPQIPLLTEESADDVDYRINSEYCFIIDPLDGTKEFVRASEEFSVNIALSKGHEPIFGVIYLPCSDTLFFGVKDGGAYRLDCASRNNLDDAIKIRVSDKRDDLTLLVGHSNAAWVNSRVGDIVDVRPMGSSMKGCMVAQGSADIAVCAHSTHEWDTAAMQCICTEAGAMMRLFSGEELLCNQADTVNYDGFYIINQAQNAFVIDKLLGK